MKHETWNMEHEAWIMKYGTTETDTKGTHIACVVFQTLVQGKGEFLLKDGPVPATTPNSADDQ